MSRSCWRPRRSLPLATAHGAQRKAAPSIDLVELDVVVVDRHSKPVTGLTAADFAVKEDGSRVEIKTFIEIRPTTPDDPEATSGRW